MWEKLCIDWWRLDYKDIRDLWNALARAKFDRPVQMQRQFDLVGYARMDLDHLFLKVLTPRYVVDAIEDLVLERQLHRAQANRLEKAVLAMVDAHGVWKDTMFES